jgi:hypothetical protein
VDCVDCHNRPSHILQSPDQSVDLALADGRLDPSLPFIKQQGVAALTAAYADGEQALRGIDSALRGYYQKTYPQVYAGKQPAIDAAIACLQDTYNRYFFPAMKVRWDTYFMNDGHFHSRDATAATMASIRAWTGRPFAPIAATVTRYCNRAKPGA